jgi:hypothetical protein
MAEAAEDLATTSELQNPTDAIAQLLTAESDGEPSEAPSKDSVKAEDTEEETMVSRRPRKSPKSLPTKTTRT